MTPRGRQLGRGPAAGFTLIEVLVSTAITATMVTLLWGSFSIGARGKQRGEEIGERYYQLRTALGRMAREITMAYLSKNDKIAPTVPRTFFSSVRNSRIDELMFSYLGHTPLRESAKECDQAIVRYYAEPDPDDRSVTNLMRRETRRLGSERPEEEGPAYVMLEDIEELHYEFYDDQIKEWRETWNTRTADGQPDRLPAKVRIAVTLRDERGKLVTFRTATRVYLRESIWFSTPAD